MHTCIHAYIHLYIYTFIHLYIHTCIHRYIHTYIHTDRQTDGRTDGQTDRHTYIHTYVHTYMYTCIHVDTDTHTHTRTHLSMHAYIRTDQMAYSPRFALGGRPHRGPDQQRVIYIHNCWFLEHLCILIFNWLQNMFLAKSIGHLSSIQRNRVERGGQTNV